MFTFIIAQVYEPSRTVQPNNWVPNNDKQEVTVTANGDSQYGKPRGMGIDFPDVQVLHNSMSSTSPTSLNWHSVLSRSLRLAVVPRRETTWLAKQPNSWLYVSCFPLCVYRQKAKRQLWNVTCWHGLAKHLTHLSVMVILVSLNLAKR